MPSAAKGGVSRHALPIIPGPLDTIATRSLGVNGERGRSLGVHREKRRSLRSLDTRSFCPRTRDERVSRSEEHTSELQSLMRITYAVFCLNKKKENTSTHNQ